jgi:predicted RNA binding protein YcfA (HicA-like mRNA interferase family)
MPKTPQEMEKIIMRDGWYRLRTRGSHRQYKHPIKKGIVTIAFHSKKTDKRHRKQHSKTGRSEISHS